MRFGVFYEHQHPRPWADGSKLELYDQALAQVELADQVGIDQVIFMPAPGRAISPRAPP